ncbi:hypothetical protein SAMN05660649_03924 [Desulfotomaculum arcticum]|uniref:Uncharacterized protein n=1 Tax=Desulfotruncus arcticus DSM 17038 TaxID=1121424 RepID=A0A1I2XIF0_9FIRM|nr:hypothetical protein [Desulfotruncus arcticus]SFH11851.1 hypothetical protein SAMN05660649_03924 [Desulfotomaculum arcticum] [Desulfotruncus arcticus DSM 17038]
MVILGILFVFSIIIWIEVPALVHKKMWRELIVFSILILIGMMLSIPQALGMHVPSPNDLVAAIFKPFAEWMKQ